MWDDPVASLHGVGAVRGRQLERRGLATVLDLLLLLPASYRRPAAVHGSGAPPRGVRISLEGHVKSRRRGRLRRGRGGYAEIVLEGAFGRLPVRFYNQPWMFERLPQGTRLLVSGRVTAEDVARLVAEDHWVLAEEAEAEPHLKSLKARHPAVPSVPPGTLRALLEQALELLPPDDPLPSAARKAAGLVELAAALRSVHFPVDEDDAVRGRQRLLFDRFLGLLLPVALLRTEGTARTIEVSPKVRARIRARFPFRFTAGQEAACEVLFADLARATPMRRLLQGDVGCGKTAVALSAALATIAGEQQVMFLAPTEPLAFQHAKVIEATLRGSRVRWALLTGGMEAAERRRVRAAAEQGELDLVVGTHALLDASLRFRVLGLVIIDEQHRFGVRQRLTAGRKGELPHLLSMSATPIPRSLCLALMGDLDHTTIRERPAGRAPVATHVVPPEDAWTSVREALHAGERAYVVFPAIDAEDLPAVLREGRALVGPQGPLHGLAHVFLHGRLPVPEREDALAAFRDGGAALMLSTVMVEVGLDVPEATRMVVVGAERFGLATLHQLRGRVGRGERPGQCLLVPASVASPQARERLQVLEREHDGFALAEHDLALRGPGELIGLRQAGHDRVLALSREADQELFETARRTVTELVTSGWDPEAGSYYGLLTGARQTLEGQPADAV